ncbi:ABC transporter substrate-binding protein [Paenarthrobacter nitroguajacolicus]|uniref:ABC transporter substrate-binding protein n=1 Tax=Paenarthrobacter nitroguajacolicus TaxID=211146 RepID=A0A558H6L7_PAENT|nr:ABC transporter substrate-binding protein [Paenarthrobacter nitroguajacolicus]TVU64770.1 ABC transporter substrate-binding protein [Paenarthrobacter nitroguajacolicus]
MSHPIDVGSVLGGRYKVTANVLTSHDQDQVLDGVDQVLNRPVSILVAGPGNAEQVAQSAREVATGERPGHVQILDLGVSDNTTYLITNHSTAPDLLDLVVATNPPYIEPFFTETLGSEIFGQPRTYEPETYDGLYEDDEHDAEYIQYDENGYPIPSEDDAEPEAAGSQPGHVPPMPSASPSSSKSGIAGKLAAAAAGAGAAGLAAAAALKNSGSKNHDAGAATGAGAAASAGGASPAVPAQPPTQAVASQPTAAPAAPVEPPTQAVTSQPAPAREPADPKVSLWSEEDYGFAGGGGAAAGRSTPDAGYDRAPTSFPASAAVQDDYQDEEVYEDEAPEKEPRSLRWLVGGLLAAVLVVGLVLAVTNLGSLLPSNTPAATQNTTAPQSTGTETEEPGPTQAPPPAAPPAIEGITRLGDFPFAATYDKDLVRAFDGNAASYWSDMEFATADWGGLFVDMPLVIKLKEKTEVKSIVLNQLGGSGGSISVYTNDRPAMDGAKLVGTNSFTSPELTMPLAAPTQTQYVIVVIKALPKLAAPKTRFGFGLRLAEVTVQ